MIIIIKAGQEHIIDELQQRFGGTHDVFAHHNRVALEGITEDELNPDERAAAEQIIDNPPKAVQGSRLFHPEDTIVETAHSKIGGDHFTMMAGPCSVESAEHVMKMAAVAKEGGRNSIAWWRI